MTWRRHGRLLLVFVAIVAAVAAGVLLRRARLRALAQVSPPEVAPWAVRSAVVQQGTVSRGFPVLAELVTSREITVTGQISGTILRMWPREGVAVRSGDLLAVIDTRELRENRAAIDAQLTAARAEARRQDDELARERALLAKGGSSETAVETLRTAALAARQTSERLEREIGALDVRLGYGRITAPADGTIAARLVEPGDLCEPGHPLYRLTVSEGLRVRVQLPQSVLARVHRGSELVLEHDGEATHLRLDRIHPALDTRALGFAETDLPQRLFGLPSGARVPGRVVLEALEDQLALPREAVLGGTSPGQGTVFRIAHDDGGARVESVPVTIILEGREGIAVAGNLAVGDEVVVAHEVTLLRLRDGDSVTVTPMAGAAR